MEAEAGREGVGVAKDWGRLLLGRELLPSLEEHAELDSLLLVLLVLPLGLVLLRGIHLGDLRSQSNGSLMSKTCVDSRPAYQKGVRGSPPSG